MTCIPVFSISILQTYTCTSSLVQTKANLGNKPHFSVKHLYTQMCTLSGSVHSFIALLASHHKYAFTHPFWYTTLRVQFASQCLHSFRVQFASQCLQSFRVQFTSQCLHSFRVQSAPQCAASLPTNVHPVWYTALDYNSHLRV